jgi:hypothetical protein
MTSNNAVVVTDQLESVLALSMSAFPEDKLYLVETRIVTAFASHCCAIHLASKNLRKL